MSYFSSPSRFNTTTTATAATAITSSSPSNRNHNHNNRDNNPSSLSQKTQDQKARDKDLSYTSYSSSSSDDDNDKKFSLPYIRREDYATLQKRREAAVILDNPELLLMYSNARNDSLAGTRYHFTKIFSGVPDEEEGEVESKKILKS